MKRFLGFFSKSACLVLLLGCAMPPLHHHASTGGVKELAAMLDSGADINESFMGFTPLISAAIDGKTEIVKLLLDRGADVNSKTDVAYRRNWTPLMYAAHHGHVETAKLLLERGADVNTRSEACYSVSDCNSYDALQIAVKQGHPLVADAIRGSAGVQSAQVHTDARSGRFKDGARQQGASPPPGPPSRFGLIDKASEVALEASLRHAAYTPPPSPSQRLSEINVLKYAYVDPAIVLLGAYDPAFPTGPIPYSSLLSDALRNPYPRFSLSHDAHSPGNREIAQRLDVDLTRAARDEPFGIQWMERLLKPLLDSSERTVERELLERRLKDSFGISPEEFTIHWSWTRRKTNRFDSEHQYFTVRKVVGKLMSKAGVPELIGQGFIAVKRMQQMETVESAINAYTLLGNLDAYMDIRDKAWKNEITIERATILLAAAAYEPILRGIKVPEPEIRRLIEGLRGGRVKQSEVLGVINTRWDRLAVRALVDHVFHGFRFSNGYLSRMYALSPVTSGVELYGAPADSPLVRLLFEADYALKYITSAAPAPTSIPDAITFHEFLAEMAARGGSAQRLPTTGVNRYWIRPGRVEMEDLGRGSGVRFLSAGVRIMAEPLESRGGNPAGDEFFRRTMAQYAEGLTARYDEYARAYPALHAIREAEKVIALARWIKARQIRVSPAPPAPASQPVPEKVEGFWGLTYLANPSGTTDTVVFWMQGGVSFDESEGEGWIGIRSNPQAERDTLHQLAAGTALAEHAAEAAADGDLEQARDLAEKSAQAMIGQIDLSRLPVPVAIPVQPAGNEIPTAAAQAAISRAALETVEANVKVIAQSKKHMSEAESYKTQDPERYTKAVEASRLAAERSAQKLKKLRVLLAEYRKAVVHIPDIHATIRTLGTAGPAVSAPALRPAADDQDWSAGHQRWISELDEVNRQIQSTREALLRLNASIQSDRRLFEEWEQAASDGFDRCVGMAADTVVDFGVGELVDRYETIHEMAKKLPDRPEDLIEKYRHLASLAKRLQEAKATGDYAGLAARENRTEIEIWETMRDGIGQISGLLGLDKTLPGAVWKYGSMAADMAYHLTELRMLWKNTKVLEANNVRYAEAVKKLAERMQELVARQKELRKKIGRSSSGESVQACYVSTQHLIREFDRGFGGRN